jgi:hypothetical protein
MGTREAYPGEIGEIGLNPHRPDRAAGACQTRSSTSIKASATAWRSGPESGPASYRGARNKRADLIDQDARASPASEISGPKRGRRRAPRRRSHDRPREPEQLIGLHDHRVEPAPVVQSVDDGSTGHPPPSAPAPAPAAAGSSCSSASAAPRTATATATNTSASRDSASARHPRGRHDPPAATTLLRRPRRGAGLPARRFERDQHQRGPPSVGRRARVSRAGLPPLGRLMAAPRRQRHSRLGENCAQEPGGRWCTQTTAPHH